MSFSTNETVNSYLQNLSEPHQSIVLKLREIAFTAEPNLEEDIKWRNCLVFKFRKNLTQMVVGKEHVTVIFFEGVQLEDPEGWLDGDGKKTRSARFKDADFSAETFKALFLQAVELNK